MRPSSAFSLLLVVVAACTDDTFTNGSDAAPDVVPSKDASRVDAPAGDADIGEDAVEPKETSTTDATQTYCELHAAAAFCDDFDDASEATASSKWSFTTPSTPVGIAFDQGLAGRGVAIASSGTTLNTFMTKQLSGPALSTLAIDVDFPQSNAAITLVRVVASAKTFAITTDPFGGNFIVTGDASTQATLLAASVGWHHFDVTFGSSTAIVMQDHTKTGSVSFPPSMPTNFSLDIGIVASTLGGSLSFDNVRVN